MLIPTVTAAAAAAAAAAAGCAFLFLFYDTPLAPHLSGLELNGLNELAKRPVRSLMER
jgi:hypothetical protein